MKFSIASISLFMLSALALPATVVRRGTSAATVGLIGEVEGFRADYYVIEGHKTIGMFFSSRFPFITNLTCQDTVTTVSRNRTATALRPRSATLKVMRSCRRTSSALSSVYAHCQMPRTSTQTSMALLSALPLTPDVLVCSRHGPERWRLRISTASARISLIPTPLMDSWILVARKRVRYAPRQPRRSLAAKGLTPCLEW